MMIEENSLVNAILPGVTEYERSQILEKSKGTGLFALGERCETLQTQGFRWNINTIKGDN